MSTRQAVKNIQEEFGLSPIYAERVYSLANKDNLSEDVARIIAEKPKPFVKWVGGKRQLLTQFKTLNLYPPSRFDIHKGTYYEPFIGGGAVFFDLLPAKAVLSDLNEELVITYKVIQHDAQKLIESLKKHKNNKEYFLKVRALDWKDLSDIETASRFIFLNRTCFNGLYRVNSKGQFNVPFGKYVKPLICDEENIRKVSKALQGIKIIHSDYKKTVRKAQEGDFVYFDPPYYPISKTSSFTSYTKESFLENNQIELRDTFAELHKRGCFIMLSNSDTPFINDIYSTIKGATITKVRAGRAVNANARGRGKIAEILVTNY